MILTKQKDEEDPTSTSTPTGVEREGEAEGEGDGQGEGVGEAEGEVVANSDGLFFKRFTEITNYESKINLGKIEAEGYLNPRHIWYSSEKVHGANFSIMTNGEQFECAKRTSLITPEEKFYGFRPTYLSLLPKIKIAYQLIKDKIPSAHYVIFYGEFFGGLYPHAAVPRVGGITHVQKGVYYSPNHHFYCFDIWVKNHSYMNYYDFEEICTKADLFFAKALQIGPFSDLMKFDVDSFETQIPAKLGLPPLTTKNIAEGIVLKPITSSFLSNGSRVIVKYKSDAFKEVSGSKVIINKEKSPKPPPAPMADSLVEYLDHLRAYVTENRLRNVLSKIGDVKRSDKSNVIGLLAKDINKDFNDDFPKFAELPKEDQKKVISKLGSFVGQLVSTNWENILNNDF